MAMEPLLTRWGGTPELTITGSGTASSPRYFTYNTPGGQATVTVSYKTYTVQTVFGCIAADYNLSQDLVDKISLPDGSVYQFNYEATPGNPSNVTVVWPSSRYRRAVSSTTSTRVATMASYARMEHPQGWPVPAEWVVRTFAARSPRVPATQT